MHMVGSEHNGKCKVHREVQHAGTVLWIGSNDTK